MPLQQTLPAGDIDRLLHGAQQRGARRANAGRAMYMGVRT